MRQVSLNLQLRHKSDMVSRMRFSRPSVLACALAAAITTPVFAQVQVQTLAPPDLFSTPAGPTDLGPDLWTDTAPGIARDALPKLAAKPLSPAFAALARKVLATGAHAPPGMGDAPDLGAARAMALIALGEAAGADRILDRVPGLSTQAGLSMVAAEAALIQGDDDKACRLGEALTVERGAAYWLRLRAFCQFRAGQTEAAQLTFSLAQQQTRDADYGRLMTALLAASPTPGAANLRNGINYALSRALKLDIRAAAGTASPAVKPVVQMPPAAPGADLAAAETSDLAFLRQAKGLAAFIEAARAASPSIAALAQSGQALQDPVLLARAALAAGDAASARALRAKVPADAVPVLDLALLDAMLAAEAGQADPALLSRLATLGAEGGARSPAQPATLLLAALGGALDAETRGRVAGFEIARSAAAPARIVVLNAAAMAGRKGETALMALSVAAEAGAAGPSAADRATLARALLAAGLVTDARAVVIEGLLALQVK